MSYRSTKCYDCGCNFSLMVRKYHCKVCEQLFCKSCMANETSQGRSATTAFTSIFSSMNIYKDLVGICNHCDKNQKELAEIESELETPTYDGTSVPHPTYNKSVHSMEDLKRLVQIAKITSNNQVVRGRPEEKATSTTKPWFSVQNLNFDLKKNTQPQETQEKDKLSQLFSNISQQPSPQMVQDQNNSTDANGSGNHSSNPNAPNSPSGGKLQSQQIELAQVPRSTHGTEAITSFFTFLGKQSMLKSPEQRRNVKNRPVRRASTLHLFENQRNLNYEEKFELRGREYHNQLLTQLLKHFNVPLVWKSVINELTKGVLAEIDHLHYINPSKYTNIVLIEGGKIEDSHCIDGILFKSHLLDKHMRNSINQPRILLFKCSIDYERESNKLSEFDQLITQTQEKNYLSNIIDKIKLLQPDIILVEKYVCRYVVEELIKLNITLITNVHHSILMKIAKFTSSYILPSITQLHLLPPTSALLTTTDQFAYFRSTILFPTTSLSSRSSDDSSFSIPSASLSSTSSSQHNTPVTLISFCGSTKKIGCSVLLRGESLEKLRIIKKILKFAIISRYNLSLESILSATEAISPSTLEEALKSVHDYPLYHPETKKRREKKIPIKNAISFDCIEKFQKNEDINQYLSYSVNMYYPEKRDVNHEKLNKWPILNIDGKYIIPNFKDNQQTTSSVIIRQFEENLKKPKIFKFGKKMDTEDYRSPPLEFPRSPMHEISGELLPQTRRKKKVKKTKKDRERDLLRELQREKIKEKERERINKLLEEQEITYIHSLCCRETGRQCIPYSIHNIKFYDEKTDCTLGHFLENFCFTEEKCKIAECNESLLYHERSFLHHRGRINITAETTATNEYLQGIQATTNALQQQQALQNAKDGKGPTVLTNDSSIIYWSYCKKCEVKTNYQRLSKKLLDYSFGKWLEHTFYYQGATLYHCLSCPHSILQQHIRYFMHASILIAIYYEPIPLYTFIPPPLKLPYTTASFNQILNYQIELIQSTLMKVDEIIQLYIDYIENQIIDFYHLEDFNNFKKSYHDEQVQINSTFQKLKEEQIESKLNDFKRFIIVSALNWNSTINDIIENIQSEKKEYLEHQIGHLNKFFDPFAKFMLHKTPKQTSGVPFTPSSVPTFPNRLTSNQSYLPQLSSSPTNNNLFTSLIPTHLPSSPTTSHNSHPFPVSHHDNKVTHDHPLSQSSDTVFLQHQHQQHQLQHAFLSQIHHTTVDYSHVHTNLDSSNDSAPLPSHSLLSPSCTSLTLPLQSQSHSHTASHSHHSHHPHHLQGLSNSLLATSFATIPSHLLPGNHPQHSVATSQPIDSDNTNLTKQIFSRIKGSYENRPRMSIPFISVPARDHTFEENQYSPYVAHHQRDHGHHRHHHHHHLQSKSSTDHDLHHLPLHQIHHYKNRHDHCDTSSSDESITMFGYLYTSHSSSDFSSSSNSSSDYSTTSATSSDSMESPERSSEQERIRSEEEIIEKLPEGEEEKKKEQTGGIPVAQIPSRYESEEDEEEDDYYKPKLGKSPSHYTNPLGYCNGKSKITILDGLRFILPNLPISVSPGALTPSALRDASGAFYDDGVNNSVIVLSESEISSYIAYALMSKKYDAFIQQQMEQLAASSGTVHAPSTSQTEQLVSGFALNENEEFPEEYLPLISDIRSHFEIAIDSTEPDSKIKATINVYHAIQFQTLRKLCNIDEHFVRSISHCEKWKASGGKSRSTWEKSLDERFVIKTIPKVESEAFINIAFFYFKYFAKAFHLNVPTLLAKILGVFTINYRSANKSIKQDVIVMENLFYNHIITKIYDLKGSLRNRLVDGSKSAKTVLLDENLLNEIFKQPLCVDEHSQAQITYAVWNDTLFLSQMHVMDYSLIVAIKKDSNELVVGIVDYIRQYTLDKQLETIVKSTKGLVTEGLHQPTVIAPQDYKTRFRTAMWKYFVLVPSKGTQFTCSVSQKRQPLTWDEVLQAYEAHSRHSGSNLYSESRRV